MIDFNTTARISENVNIGIDDHPIDILDQQIKLLYNKLTENNSVGIFDYQQFIDKVHIIKNELLAYTVQDIVLVSGLEEDINTLRKLLLH